MIYCAMVWRSTMAEDMREFKVKFAKVVIDRQFK
jgi:hypothetical protein